MPRRPNPSLWRRPRRTSCPPRATPFAASASSNGAGRKGVHSFYLAISALMARRRDEAGSSCPA